MRAGATTKTDADLAARARAFDLGVFERASDRVVRDERATLISTPSLRRVPHLHGVVLHGPMGADDAEALADEHFGDLPFRRLLAADDGLVGALEARGWRDDPVLLLARDAALEPPGAEALHAARAERHDLVFVPTAAEGGAGPLYASLGFERVATLHWLIKSHPPRP